MRENSIGDNPRRRAQRRQMPDMHGGGDDPSSLPKEINEKNLGTTDVPKRRTLRGVELPVPDNSGELKKHKGEEPRETTIKERHPDWPEIKIKIFASNHVNLQDTQDIGEYVPEADIFFYEMIYNPGYGSLREEDLTTMNALSKSEADWLIDEVIDYGKHGNGPIKGTFVEPIYRAIARSKIVVGHIDYRDESIDGLQAETADFDGTLENMYVAIKQYAFSQQQREAKMVNEYFEPEIESILRKYPELREKDSITVLMQMGYLHKDSLSSKFEHQDIQTEVVVPTTIVMNPLDQLRSELMQGVEPENIREKLAKGYFCNLFTSELERAIGTQMSHPAAQIYSSHLANQFTVEEIKEIYDYIEANELSKVDELVEPRLEQAGLTFPTTDDELKILASSIMESRIT